jgi:integrase
VRTETGGRKQVKLSGFASRDDAQAALTAALGAVERGEFVDSGRAVPDMAEYLPEWLAGKRKLRPSTRASYQQHLDDHLVPLLGRVKLTSLRAAHIERALTALMAGDAKSGRAPLSVATARRVFSTLRGALNSAVKQRRITFNPCAGVEVPAEPHTTATTWSAEQVGVFLRAAEGDRLAALFRLVLLRGLRRGEAVGLRWSDVDLAAGTLRVAQAAVLVNGEVHIGDPKSRAGARVISLDPRTVAALRAHRKAQNAERLAWAGAYDENDLVFAQATGEVEQPSRVTRRFRAIAKAAGLPSIKLHEGRHTAASLALRQGASMKEVQELLGHSTYALTADTYSHVSADTRDATAARVAAAVEGA